MSNCKECDDLSMVIDGQDDEIQEKDARIAELEKEHKIRETMLSNVIGTRTAKVAEAQAELADMRERVERVRNSFDQHHDTVHRGAGRDILILMRNEFKGEFPAPAAEQVDHRNSKAPCLGCVDCGHTRGVDCIGYAPDNEKSCLRWVPKHSEVPAAPQRVCHHPALARTMCPGDGFCLMEPYETCKKGGKWTEPEATGLGYQELREKMGQMLQVDEQRVAEMIKENNHKHYMGFHDGNKHRTT